MALPELKSPIQVSVTSLPSKHTITTSLLSNNNADDLDPQNFDFSSGIKDHLTKWKETARHQGPKKTTNQRVLEVSAWK